MEQDDAAILRDLQERSAALNSREDYVAWEELCNKYIESLEERSKSKRPRLSIGVKRSVINQIARLEGLKNSIRQRFAHEDSGSGASDTDKELFWRDIDTAFASRILTGAVINLNHVEPRKFLKDASDTVLPRLQKLLGNKHKAIKVNTEFNGVFVTGDKHENKSINTQNHELFSESDLRQWYEQHVVKATLTSLEEFEERDSGWALLSIQHLMINVNTYVATRVGCSFQLPRQIIAKRAVINVQSDDNACFMWSVVAALYPSKKNVGRMSSYPCYKKVFAGYDKRGIELPMTLGQIGKFERSYDISVNVLGVEEESPLSIVPLRLTERKMEKHVNLLYFDDPRDYSIGHFTYIASLSRLLGSQVSKKKVQKYFCDRCMHYFYSNEKLQAHTVDCGDTNDCAIKLPNKNNKWLSFSNHGRKERVPFVVYADLECVLEKTEEKDHDKYQHRHRPCSIGYYVRCSYDELNSYYRFRRGPNCISWFVEELHELAHRVKTILSTNVPMASLTRQQQESFVSATSCHICEQPFKEDDKRDRDHCHLTGRYRGPAHQSCNLNYKASYTIPVIFHNLSGYDAHFIVKEIATMFDGKVDILPLTKEKYISFTKHVKDTEKEKDSKRCIKLRFIDSFKFLSTSLDELAKFLSKDKLKIMQSEFQDLSEEKFDLLTRKGVFPYEYVDSEDKLLDHCLPPRESFYSSLTDDSISDSDYAHAEKMWQSFDVQTLGEYSDLYLKIDVLLLVDIFENFRNSCIKSYGLDPAHYFTLPGFTWDAMLKYTQVNLELLTDIDMVLFIERGIRGGLSQCSNRYARANNKYMQSYDPSKVTSYLMYFDVNNLYGWAMCEPLPYAEFKWVEDASNFDVTSIGIDSPIGYILEVDLEYPQRLHDEHADLPFCPSHDKPPGKCQSKLLATVSDKERYVIHYRNLQQCISHGLRITKIHRVLQFKQSAWLKPYIELNTQFRTDATNEFEKNLFKLMNNAVFGKTMENVRNYVVVKLVTQWDGRYGAEALISKPNFHSRSIFSENLVAIELRKLKVHFNKPIYVGMCILDMSKTCVYEFHYDYMLPLYRDKCRIMYTDTDSLIYHIESDDVYEHMKLYIRRFDTSDYTDGNVYHMPRENKKLPGLMKDENKGSVMTEFVGLRSKMYAFRVDGKKDTKKIKGIKNCVVARTITFDDYTRCLNEDIEMERRQSYIRSTLHEVYTVQETKIALSPYDDKRYIIPGTTDTLPWGHYKIPQ